MIRTIMPAVIALLAATPAAAQDWRLVEARGQSPERFAMLADTQSIRRDGDRLTLRTQTVYETAYGGRDYDKVVHMHEVNCATGTATIVSASYYMAGRPVDSDTLRGRTLAYPAGSIMHSVIEAACGRRAYAGGPYADPDAAMRSRFASQP